MILLVYYVSRILKPGRLLQVLMLILLYLILLRGILHLKRSRRPHIRLHDWRWPDQSIPFAAARLRRFFMYLAAVLEAALAVLGAEIAACKIGGHLAGNGRL